MNSQSKEETTPARPGPQPGQSEANHEKKPVNERVSREQLCHYLYFEDNDCFFAPPWMIDDRKRKPSVDEKMPSDSRS